VGSPTSAANSVTVLTSTGTPFAAKSAIPLQAPSPIRRASPSTRGGYAWISNSGANNVILIQNIVRQPPITANTPDNAIQGSAGIAADASGNKWVAATGINAVSSFTG
jgi:hypothetical protein